MQQVVFRTENPTMEITVNDVGTSKITYTSGYSGSNPTLSTIRMPNLELFDFDGNSVAAQADTVTCVGMPGQHTIGKPRLQPRTVAITIAFDGRNMLLARKTDTDSFMYTARRRIMKCFPPGVAGLLTYTNANGTFNLRCYATEYPNLERSVGTRIVTTLYLVADFPYWYRSVSAEPFTVSANGVHVATMLTEGDVESPIIGEIKCTQTMSGAPETLGPYNRYMYLWEPEGHDENGTESGAKMSFCKPLKAGQTLIFNTGLNNEVYVRLRESDGTERAANDYVDYNNSSLLRNRIGNTKWQLHVDGEVGTVEVTIKYQNLYLAV